MIRKVSVLIISVLVLFLFVINFPTSVFGPDHSSIFIFTPYSNQFFSTMVHYRIISSDHYLNNPAALHMVSQEFQFNKKLILLSPIENIYQDITKFPAGEYKCFLTQENDPEEILSNTFQISIKSDLPSLTIKDWAKDIIKKVTTRNLTIEIVSTERLRQVSLLIDNQMIHLEDYGYSWKWNGSLPLQKGINDIIIMGTNFHNITSRKLYKIQLEEERFAKKIPVLVYHNIGYMQGSFNVTPDVFEIQLKELVQQGCYFADPSELYLFYLGKINLPEKTVMITFDDGYKGIQQYALPLLKKFNIKATLFVVTNFIGNTSFLTWDQLDEIACSPLFTLGSHTNDLHFYKKNPSFPINYPALLRYKMENESIQAYQTRVLDDLNKSKKVLEKRYPTRKINTFAYPFGANNQDAVALVKKARFELAFAYDSQKIKWMSRNSNLYLLERFPIFQYSTNKNLFREEK